MGILQFVLLVVFAVAGIGLFVVRRRQQDDAMRRAFAELRFDTPGGDVDGSALRVVKVVRQSITPNQVEGLDTTRDEFWYCVGPGPSYFLAIPTVASRYGAAVGVRWVVRPLSPERMRGALTGDRRALRLAFGEAVEV